MAQDLGARIRQARERKRMTQRDLADAVGVDRRTVDNWENERSTPRNRLGSLEDVLGITLYDLGSAQAEIEKTRQEVLSRLDQDIAAGEEAITNERFHETLRDTREKLAQLQDVLERVLEQDEQDDREDERREA